MSHTQTPKWHTLEWRPFGHSQPQGGIIVVNRVPDLGAKYAKRGQKSMDSIKEHAGRWTKKNV
eukprot:664009-Pelagomonas_calceolata.AAC.5